MHCVFVLFCLEHYAKLSINHMVKPHGGVFLYFTHLILFTNENYAMFLKTVSFSICKANYFIYVS